MMDAIKFVKQLRRMNEQGVPKKRFIYPCAGQETDSPEEVVAEVEEWAKEHPTKTRQSVFLEQYPKAKLTEDGVLALCPIAISSECSGENGRCASFNRKCGNCRREFWSAEVEDA